MRATACHTRAATARRRRACFSRHGRVDEKRRESATRHRACLAAKTAHSVGTLAARCWRRTRANESTQVSGSRRHASNNADEETKVAKTSLTPCSCSVSFGGASCMFECRKRTAAGASSPARGAVGRWDGGTVGRRRERNSASRRPSGQRLSAARRARARAGVGEECATRQERAVLRAAVGRRATAQAGDQGGQRLHATCRTQGRDFPCATARQLESARTAAARNARHDGPVRPGLGGGARQCAKKRDKVVALEARA